MAYTGWNRLGTGQYWPGQVGTGWNRLEPFLTSWNRFKSVETV
jgi:hypothetical protein